MPLLFWFNNLSRRTLIRTGFILVPIVASMFSSVPAQEISRDEKIDWERSERLLAEGKKTGALEPLIEAARLRNQIANSTWLSDASPGDDWSEYFDRLTDGGAVNGILTATDILDNIEIPDNNAAELSAMIQKLRKHVIIPSLGKVTFRRWPMVNGGHIEFDVKILESRNLNLRIISIKYESKYTIEVQRNDGLRICESQTPKFEFECSWDANSAFQYDIKIVSTGPLSSTMQLALK
jgi:hypothetical protein